MESCHGAIGALTMAHLRLSHKIDLCEMADEIHDDVDIRRLIVEFSYYAEAIIAIVDVEQVIKDAPLLE